MNIITNYISKEFLRFLLLCTCALIVVYLVVDLFENVDFFIKNRVESKFMIQYLLFEIPKIFSMIIPLSSLLATILTLGLLSKNSEIIAMKSNGISIYYIVAPILMAAMIISILTFVFTESIIPYANRKVDYIKNVIMEKKSEKIFFQQDRIWFRSDGSIFNVQLFEPVRSTMYGITIFNVMDNFQIAERTDARELRWENGRWYLISGERKRFKKDGTIDTKSFEKEPIGLDKKPADLQRIEVKPGNLRYADLKKYVGRIKKEGYNATRYLVDLYSKVSLPFVTFIMVLLGIPFSLWREKTPGIALGIGLCILIGFSYWIVLSISISLGHGGIVPPLLSAWFANLLFGSIGIITLLSLRG